MEVREKILIVFLISWFFFLGGSSLPFGVSWVETVLQALGKEVYVWCVQFWWRHWSLACVFNVDQLKIRQIEMNVTMIPGLSFIFRFKTEFESECWIPNPKRAFWFLETEWESNPVVFDTNKQTFSAFSVHVDDTITNILFGREEENKRFFSQAHQTWYVDESCVTMLYSLKIELISLSTWWIQSETTAWVKGSRLTSGHVPVNVDDTMALRLTRPLQHRKVDRGQRRAVVDKRQQLGRHLTKRKTRNNPRKKKDFFPLFFAPPVQSLLGPRALLLQCEE